MLHTTARLAKEHGACESSYRKFSAHVGGVRKFGLDTPIPLTEILEVCGLDNAIWCLQCTTEPSDKLARLFACDCAERVLPIYEEQYPDDKRPHKAIETTRLFAEGKATDEELAAAEDAAWAAAGDAAEDAARDAGDAAWAAAWAAARDAAEELAAAYAATGNAESQWQTERFKYYLEAEV